MDPFHSYLKIKKKMYSAILNGRSFKWTRTHKRERPESIETIPLVEIIAVQKGLVEIVPCKKIINTPNDFTVFFVKRAPKCQQRWILDKMVFTAEDSNLRDQWVSQLSQRIEQHGQQRPQRLLVFINPFGGRGKARKIYYSRIAQLFELAGINVHVLETERANQARDYILQKDLSSFDGVVCVGGDGMFSELMHGLIGRSQREACISEDDPEATLQGCSLRIGIIPAGSTNCVCFATVGVNDPITSALHIIVGDSQPLDVCAVHHKKQFIKYSVSMVGYGFYGDVLSDSDKHRWMGPIRYDYSGFKVFLQNRSYQGIIEYQLAGTGQSNPRDNTRCRTGCMVCSESTERLCSPEENAFDNVSQGSYKSQGSDEEVIDEWHSAEGTFKAINMTCMSSACPKSPDGLSPCAHLADGTADLIIVRKCSRVSFLRHLFRHTNQKDQFDLPFVDVFRVKALKFTPIPQDDDDESLESTLPVHLEYESVEQTKSSFLARLCGGPSMRSKWNCDGEVMPHAAINVRVHSQLIKLFARGIEGPCIKRRESWMPYR
uniref:Ceramide kinase-like n=1 Tax=Erpetoichthys calabaricus TaxID=27687 RepID=A0A8C4SDB2_ERPCA